MTTSPAPQIWTEQLIALSPPRAKSLVMTLFGDVIRPHGGALWLGSLIRLLSPFGVNDRLVRTSVFRLVEEGWLSAQREGRRSLYALNSTAARRFELAYRRVYEPVRQKWDGAWTLVFAAPDALDTKQRADLRKELLWEGFGSIAPMVFIHPRANQDTVDDILTRARVKSKVFVCAMTQAEVLKSQPLGDLIAQCWQLDIIADRYEAFIARFGPAQDLLKQNMTIDPEQAFIIRTLLIHEYRRLHLHDPLLPLELLPPNWAGTRAYDLCHAIYSLSFERAERYILDTLRREDDRAPEAAPYFYQRFGGLLTT
ncbi:MAG: phenylacetic acid degradation operon negative regulatory protein PaaX [Paralcaligenes sp.]